MILIHYMKYPKTIVKDVIATIEEEKHIAAVSEVIRVGGLPEDWQSRSGMGGWSAAAAESNADRERRARAAGAELREHRYTSRTATACTIYRILGKGNQKDKVKENSIKFLWKFDHIFTLLRC